MDFHLTQSAYSDPGDLDVSGLPRDPGQLAGLVRDVIIHRGEGERFGNAIPRERLREDAESRYVGDLVRILRERKDAPLTERRAPAERFVGTCRDFALLHCSLLRATGTPARIRCGFATYFIDGFHEDHWVTEYRPIRSYTTYTGLRQVTLRRSGTASPGGSTAATPAR